MRTFIIAFLIGVLLAAIAFGEPRRHERNKNYILRRQQAYQVQGVPTSRLIIGKRQIDIYRNGLMFERDHVVGVRGTR
jgi:hypothetical protein